MEPKELKVLIGVVRRGVKELRMYRQEVREGEAQLAALSPQDETFRQRAQTLEESKAMVAHTVDRLSEAAQRLSGAIHAAGERENAEGGVNGDDGDKQYGELLAEARRLGEEASRELAAAR